MAAGAKPKNDPSAWLTKAEDVKDVPPPARELLETYAGVPSEEVVPHVLKLVSQTRAMLSFLFKSLHMLCACLHLVFGRPSS
jgi:hypothetical protein